MARLHVRACDPSLSQSFSGSGWRLCGLGRTPDWHHLSSPLSAIVNMCSTRCRTSSSLHALHAAYHHYTLPTIITLCQHYTLPTNITLCLPSLHSASTTRCLPSLHSCQHYKLPTNITLCASTTRYLPSLHSVSTTRCLLTLHSAY